MCNLPGVDFTISRLVQGFFTEIALISAYRLHVIIKCIGIKFTPQKLIMLSFHVFISL